MHADTVEQLADLATSITPEQVAGTRRTPLIQEVARALKHGEKINAATVESLFTKVLADDAGMYVAMSNLTPVDFETARLPAGISDSDDDDGLLTVSKQAFERMNADEQPTVLKKVLELFLESDYENPELFINSLLSAASTSVQKDALFSTFVNFIHDHTTSDDERFGYYDHPAFIISHMSPYYTETLKALARAQNESETKKLLGIFASHDEYVHLINNIRTIMQDPTTKTHEKEGLERIGKMLLGVDPHSNVPFFTSLTELYASIEFEAYPTNEATQSTDVNFIQEALAPLAAKPGVVVDLACGTGRIANALAAAEVQPIVAIDQSDRHIEIATQADTTGTITYEQADWDRLPLAVYDAKAVYCMGRSLPHTQTAHGFSSVLGQVNAALQHDGLFIFDMPDPYQGDYAKNRQAFERVLQTLGAPQKDTFIVVDGPSNDGKVYNRYCPPGDSL